jgi:hypothetical protein
MEVRVGCGARRAGERGRPIGRAAGAGRRRAHAGPAHGHAVTQQQDTPPHRPDQFSGGLGGPRAAEGRRRPWLWADPRRLRPCCRGQRGSSRRARHRRRDSLTKPGPYNADSLTPQPATAKQSKARAARRAECGGRRRLLGLRRRDRLAAAGAGGDSPRPPATIPFLSPATHTPKRNSPFLRSSGLPFFTVHMTMSPGAAAGRRLRRAPNPETAMMYKFLAPELSAQFMTAPTGRPRDMRNLLPAAPPRPRLDAMVERVFFGGNEEKPSCEERCRASERLSHRPVLSH